jgi:hypothetical protein
MARALTGFAGPGWEAGLAAEVSAFDFGIFCSELAMWKCAEKLQ